MAAYFLLGIVEEKATRSRPRVFRDRTRILDTLDDDSIIRRYRLPRHAIFKLIDLLKPYLASETERSHALSPETQVLIALRFYSKGSFFTELADLHGVSQSTVSRVFTRTNEAIVKQLKLISFPKATSDQRVTKEAFYNISRFPKVLGCIDGTLIPIMRPTGDEEAVYVCRKGFHAVNVQAVCDAELRFTSVVSKWPGSTHDSFMLQNSKIGQYMETAGNDGWLLGDSGYACRPWLLTPIVNPTTPSEERYNTAHCRTRNTVERAFGLLKSRFRCLHKSGGCLPFTPPKCHQVVYATCQLHNFCISLRLPAPPTQEDLLQEDGIAYLGPLNDGLKVRQAVVNNCFSK
ncbi:putative nuclease HARBI1 [Haliotis rufescens]|uniref:putative nuclease HARBI1 n=1 Tax=Haliotis rufescens TaxID=6454 RepID=UPI001EB03B28|nr:putative nuclease HARBI1 [Haliotis rufescens]XP_048243980.1 putative nuclease HARBI1 [Haliotis rufescens]XP_048259516.1 putative nuclease HARBI1 [Haliotis rufescens]